MQRQRPMSTRTGVPTAATFVFVNMINKLRRDFQPEYFAAVFDVSGAVFRDERARSIATVRKWNIKTQTFDEIDYAGYKANRTEMPPGPGAAVAVHPPIAGGLSHPHSAIRGFRSRRCDRHAGAAGRRAGHDVFVVSNDKDMLQLVTGQSRCSTRSKTT
jgi:DNA polymerase-1